MNNNKKEQDPHEQTYLSDEIEDIFTKSDSTSLPPAEMSSELFSESRLASDMGLGKNISRGHSENTIAKYLLFALPVTLALLFALFVWPGIYQFSSMKQGSRDYLVKTNRLTGSHSYFYGGKWLDKPIADAPLRLPDPLSVISHNDQPVTATIKPEKERTPERVPDKAPPIASPQAKQPAAAAKTLKDVPPAATASVKENKQPVTVVPEKPTAVHQSTVKAEKPPAAQPDVKENAETQKVREDAVKPASHKKEKAAALKPYAIQIGAFATEDEVRVFLADQESNAGIYWLKVQIKGKPWYRVFIGHFSNPDEARTYLKKKKVPQRFPGSFVQKVS